MASSLTRSTQSALSNPWRQYPRARVIILGIMTYLLCIAGALAYSAYSISATRAETSASVTAPATDMNQPLVDGHWGYDFSGYADGPLSPDEWNFESGTTVANYNDEAQAYTPRQDNVRIQDGALVIEAKPEAMHGRQYTSARINTLGKFDFTYGTLEVEAMLPQGNGTWPAAWLMPVSNRYMPADFGIADNDKHSWVVNGEIDFLEAIGRIPGQNIPAAHTYNQMKRETMYTPGYITQPYTQYHTYGVNKTPTKIEFTIDGTVFASREKASDNPLDWPYDQPYYLILNLAIGGDWAGADGIDDSSAPWQMKIRTISYKPL